MINKIIRRNIYHNNYVNYYGINRYRYYKYYKKINHNSEIIKLIKNRKMKIPKNYKTQYETRDYTNKYYLKNR